MRANRPIALSLLILAISVPSFAQLAPSAEWGVHAANRYQIFPNVTYLTASNWEAKMDIYKRRDTTGPQPTLVYMHGGFWAAGTKEGSLMAIMPWLEMGWNVVNVEYRLARVALAPAAVEDCLCALRYINNQAKTYDIDTTRIVLTGESAGGHLSGHRRPGQAMRRSASAESRGDHQLVRHYRCL
jgi:acetyl esterase/lipase